MHFEDLYEQWIQEKLELELREFDETDYFSDEIDVDEEIQVMLDTGRLKW